MKKFGFMMMVLLFAGMGMLQAQPPQQQNGPMRGYFQQTVLPFIEKQQAKLEQALTPAEKQELQKIREEMAVFRKQGMQMRQAMQGHFNQQALDARKAQFKAIVAKARKLVEAHPQAAAAYKNAVEKELARMKQQMPAMNGNSMGQNSRGHGMMGKSPQAKMQKLSDPALGLIMDVKAMKGMMMHSVRGMQANRKGMHAGRGMQPKRQMKQHDALSYAIMRALQQPAVKSKIKAYREKNILPVVRAQREAFDKVLTKKEKKRIAEIRNSMKAMRMQRMQMRSQGVRPSDSARLAMQQKMDEDRVAVRQIILNHYGAFQIAMAPIKEKMPRWRKDIRKIVAEYVVEQQMQHMSGKYGKTPPMLKEKGGMMFLLMDPAHPDTELYMPFPGVNKKR